MKDVEILRMWGIKTPEKLIKEVYQDQARIFRNSKEYRKIITEVTINETKKASNA